MKPKVYIETSIPSYLTAWRSPDLVMAANQEITKDWWENRKQFDLYVSVLVIQEAGAGDKNAAKRRLDALENIPEIRITEEVEAFANVLLEKVPLPQKAWFDALHIAAATIGGMDYL
jgi:predicted nucleic acid-binding protein